MRYIVWSVADNYVLMWWVGLMVAKIAYSLSRDAAFTRFCVFMHQQLWIGMPVALLLDVVLAPPAHNMLAPLVRAVLFAYIGWRWWRSRDWPDENPWKRRGRRLKEKVAARGAKLVVVPETA